MQFIHHLQNELMASGEGSSFAGSTNNDSRLKKDDTFGLVTFFSRRAAQSAMNLNKDAIFI